MKSLFLVKRGPALFPNDPYSEELLDAYPNGKELRADVKDDRSRGQLREYWAGLGLLVKNFDEEDEKRWPTSRAMNNALLESLGYTEKLWRIDGTYRNVPSSIALENMTDAEFTAYYEKAQAICVRLFGYNPFELWKAEKQAQKAAHGGGR